MSRKRFTGLLMAAPFLVLVLFQWCIQSASSFSAPQQIYARAWQLVRDNYYDTQFGGQDWDKWQHKYDGKLQSVDDAYAAVKEMLSSLKDPYTRFLDPKAFKEEDDAINSVVCGIGISLKPFQEVKALIVNEVVETGPAYKAGIAFGDKIVAIDGESTDKMDTDKAASKIRGKVGTALKLQIQRGEQIKSVQITRQRIVIPAVTAKVIEANLGYIKLSTFMADDASVEFRTALQRLEGVNGLIVDMRNNPGGLLANAIEIADMLLPQGKTVVTTVSRRGKVADSASGFAPVLDKPVVVLVDGDSASASEILAGALKDNRRATIIGTKTFGKGLVQEINRLPGGAGMHVTVARYLTPNGTDINKIGIVPDVSVTERDKQLKAAVEMLQNRVASAGKARQRASSGT